MAWTQQLTAAEAFAGYTTAEYIGFARDIIREADASFISDSDIVDILNDVRRALAIDYLPITRIAQYSDANSNFNSIVELPSDLISLNHIEAVKWNNKELDILPDSDDIDTTETGTPTTAYTWSGAYLLLYPRTSETPLTTTLEMKYYALPADLTEGSPTDYEDDFPAGYKDYIVFSCAERIYRRRQLLDKATYHEQKAVLELKMLRSYKKQNRTSRRNLMADSAMRSTGDSDRVTFY